MQRYYHSVAQQAVARLVERYPADRPLRVLEIGAGTGGLTSYVLPLLPAGPRSYVFTDLSSGFFGKAEQKFGDFPFVEYRRLDIENDPTEQGYEPHSFDLVVASQVLHATADLRRTLDHVAALLAPSGLLLMLEAVRPARWFDLVFGLMEGWWRFTDIERRPSQAMMPLDAWKRVLQEAGFSEPTDLALADGEEPLESAVVIARGPAGEAIREQPATEPPAADSGRWLHLRRPARRRRQAGEATRRGNASLVYAADLDAASRDDMQPLPGAAAAR